MANEVVIKSNRYGLNLILDDQTPFPELLRIIGNKFQETGGFFQNAKMAVSFEGRQLSPAQQKRIADGIMATLETQNVAGGGNMTGNSRGNNMGNNMMGNGQNCPVCPSMPEGTGPEQELYRVQAGAFRDRQNADNLLSLLENDGFPAYIIYQDGLYKVQVGAYSRLSNAIAMEREVRQKGYNTYITT